MPNPTTSKPNRFARNGLARVGPAIAAGFKAMTSTLFGGGGQTGYGHGGASTRKNYGRGWDWGGGDARGDIGVNLPTLQQRSRDLYMNSPMARAAIGQIKINSVGEGLRMQPSPEAWFLGLDTDAAALWSRRASWEFRLWANSRECDALGLNTFGELEGLALLSWLQSGDCFALLPMRQSDQTPYELRVRVIEADRVCNPGALPMLGPWWMGSAGVPIASLQALQLENGNTVQNGVEIDGDGCVVAYWISRVHPLSRDYSVERGQWDRVPVRDAITGRLNIVHMFTGERPEQHRGVPLLAPVIESIKQITRYAESELAAAVVSSMFTVFVKSQTPQSPLGEAIPGYEQVNRNASDREFNYELAPGAVIGLAPDEDISTATPGRPNAAFEAFYTAVAREVGAAIGTPYEVMLQAFTASYSASRAALLSFWKTARAWRWALKSNFSEPVYREFMTEAILKGRIVAPGFLDDAAIRAAWLGAEWHGPAMGQIDPKKEVEAAEKRIALGVSTLSRESTELTGTQWDDNIEQRGVENRLMLGAGLVDVTQLIPSGQAEPGDPTLEGDTGDRETTPAPSPSRQ